MSKKVSRIKTGALERRYTLAKAGFLAGARFALQSAGNLLNSGEERQLRQKEILSLVATGSTYSEIGETLSLSEATVRYHMAQIMDRLHLQNRAQVIAYAAQHGLARDAQTQ